MCLICWRNPIAEMKVVLVGPVYPYRGGIAHYTTMLYRAFKKRGHDVLMISFKRQYPQWLYPGRSDKDPSKQPLVIENAAKYWIDSLNPFTWLTTFWHIWRYQPDVIVLQWWTTFWAPVWLTIGVLNRLWLRKPLFYICHNVLPHETRRWDRLLTKVVLHWGSYFIVQSPREKHRLLSLLPYAQVTVIPHPVYDMFAYQKITKEEARKRLGLPTDVPILLFFGIVREYKGLRDLLAAIPEIRERLGRVMLLIAGEFWDDKQHYLEIIDRLGIRDSVVIEDRYIPNEEIGLYFSAADALIVPYRQLTGSGVVQMARGFGTPIILASTFGFRESEPTRHQMSIESPSLLANQVVRFFAEGYKSNAPKDLETASWDRLVDVIAGPVQGEQI